MLFFDSKYRFQKISIRMRKKTFNQQIEFKNVKNIFFQIIFDFFDDFAFVAFESNDSKNVIAIYLKFNVEY